MNDWKLKFSLKLALLHFNLLTPLANVRKAIPKLFVTTDDQLQPCLRSFHSKGLMQLGPCKGGGRVNLLCGFYVGEEPLLETILKSESQ